MPVIKKPSEHFDATLWTGDNTNPRAITNSGGFQPDLVWLKARNSGQFHVLNDSVRGAGTAYGLSSQATNAEGNADIGLYGATTAFNSNGFSVGSGTSNQAFVNLSTVTYVGWQWKAGGAAVANTSGSISSQVSVNSTAGFSIVTYTGTGSNATVGHGLGATPSMVIVKCRSTAGESWHTYHVGLSSLANTVYLNGTAAQGSFPTCFNSMSTLNSTVFSLGTDGASNGSGRTYVAYCFAQVAGYSAFGSYTGNGSTDGPFVFTNFRPRFVMFKRTDTIANWTIRDTARRDYNSNPLGLFSNLSIAEDSTSGREVDMLSNGFKIRGTDSDLNTSSGTYIYMAFAENTFKFANAR